DDDTPLLRAVRMRNEECVRLLLEKGAKVSASDKRGDTALHIAIRARSKRITELLLRNPRHSRLLYRLNKAGESPYSMDTYHQRGILPQIYGHGNLNATDAENLLGYEIYSSALADILSEPCLITPITMGLYAKWGSGKSFLLDKLRVEMGSFTQQNNQAELNWSWLITFLLLIINSIVGEAFGLAFGWIYGLAIGLGIIPIEFCFMGLVIFMSRKYDIENLNRITVALARKQKLLRLFIQMLFCIPKQKRLADKQSGAQFCVRFLFSECTRLTSVGGEKSLAAMIGTLCDAVEKEYGIFIARLFRVFKPHLSKNRSSSFKSICCIPYFVIFLLILICIQTGIALAVAYGIENSVVMNGVLIALASIVGLAVVANMYTWGQMFLALVFSQKKRVIRAAEHIEELKIDGFMQQLKREVDLLSKMVNCMDCFTDDQTRLVVIVDGLDSCEQDKVLQVLDTVKSLFSDDGSPFITILAVDPHIIIKGIEQNLRSSFQDTNVNGFDYLRNVVHLPFYLQSQGMRIQQVDPTSNQLDVGDTSPSKAMRQDSVLTSVSSDTRPGRKASRAMGSSHMVGGSLSGSLPGITYASSFDLTSTMAKNDYFSDINPRSMRRLMNIVAVTARLLRAYNIDFKWHRLAAWINLTEQWPYRLSWIIYYFEEADVVENSASLYSLYKKINPNIPSTKEQDPLLEIDRNVRKLEASLTSKSGNFPLLNVADLKKFLPCTINLDPYLRKLIRETQHNMERHQAEIATLGGVYPPPPPPPSVIGSLFRDGTHDRAPLLSSPARFNGGLPLHQPLMYGMYGVQPPMPYAAPLHNPNLLPGYMQAHQMMFGSQDSTKLAMAKAGSQTKTPKDFFANYIRPVVLSKCSVDDVCDLLSHLKGLSPDHLSEYQASIRDNNISGLVLAMCDLSELQPVIKMRFGDWQLFRSAIQILVSAETQSEIQSDVKTDGVETSQSIHTAQLTQSSSGISYTDHSSSMSNTKAQPSRSFSLQEPNSSSRFGQKTELQKIRERKMRRNDSIVQQLSYETAILKSAVSGFVEESEEDEEQEDEDDDETEPSQGMLELCSVREENEIDIHEKRPTFQLGEDSPSGSPERHSSMSSHSEHKTYTISKDTDTDKNLIEEYISKTDSDFLSYEEKILCEEKSDRKDLEQPTNVQEITPFIKILDRPKSHYSSQGSGEFVPLLGSIQLHPTPGGSTEFVPGSNNLSMSTDTLLDIEPPLKSTEQILPFSSPSAVQESPSSSASKQPSQHVAFALGSFRQQPTHHDHIGNLARSLAVDKSDSESTSEAEASPAHHSTNSLASNAERITKPNLGQLKHHYQSTSTDSRRGSILSSTAGDEEFSFNPSLRGSLRSHTDHVDLVQQSYSTIVEMSSAATEVDETDFHHRLGVRFANVDQLPDSDNSSPDRETNV
ncbi:kinase D-interacting substrate of 220 kDa, partial [Biomphalaria glabrata]